MTAPERIYPSDAAGLCEIADDLADRIADLRDACRAAHLPMLGVVAGLDEAHHQAVIAANMLAGKR